MKHLPLYHHQINPKSNEEREAIITCLNALGIPGKSDSNIIVADDFSRITGDSDPTFVVSGKICDLGEFVRDLVAFRNNAKLELEEHFAAATKNLAKQGYTVEQLKSLLVLAFMD